VEHPEAVSALLVTLFGSADARAPGTVDDDALIGLLREHPRHAIAIASVYEGLYGKRLAWLAGGDTLSAALPTRHPAMSDALVAGLDLCAGHCNATGWRELSTTTVFQVYRWSQPWVVAALPDGALRDVEAEFTGQATSIFHADLLLSACLRKSLAGLCRSAAPGVSISFHDLFFDLARFGGGRSVENLRARGVDLTALDTFSRRLGVGQNSRHGPVA
jgi:hypothetical protein